MSADDSVEDMFVDIKGSQAEAAVDGCGGAAGKGPGRVSEVGEGGVCVLKVGNDYCVILLQ